MPGADADLEWTCRRTSFGATPELRAEARALGRDEYVARQLDPARIDDARIEQRLAGWPSLSRTAPAIRDDFDGPAMRLEEATVWRALESRRQLYERVVEVWNDHFSIDQGVGECRILKTVGDREAIRAHALGRFGDLLAAVTRSAAMLEYLDNRTNVAVAPNENFARELLELHSVGTGAFDEEDVREVARCFTGWTMRPIRHPDYGQFTFDPATHDDGAKCVLGLAIGPGGGASDGERVLALLASHPATARRVARRFLAAFADDQPSESEIARVAAVFLGTSGDVREVVRAALQPPIANGFPAQRPKFQRPLRFVISTLRCLRARVEHVRGIVDELASLGHRPHAWPTPDGYPEDRSAWESALLARWRFAESLIEGRVDGVSVDAEALLAGGRDAGRVERANALLEGGKLTQAELDTLRAHALGGANDRRVLVLALCAPSAQEYG